MEQTGNELGGGGWSELEMNGEAGVGANWECIGRRWLERTGNELGVGVGANWECIGRRGLERTGNNLGGRGWSKRE